MKEKDCGFKVYSKKLLNSVNVRQVCIFNVESACLHVFECSFNLPAFLIGCGSFFLFVERYDNLQFRFPFLILQSGSGEVTLLNVHIIDTYPVLKLSEFQMVEHPPCLELLAGFGVFHPNVFPDAQMIRYPFPIQVFQPVLSDKFPVCHRAFYVGFTEQTDKPVYYLFPFPRVGVLTFGQQPEQDWECNSLVSNL